MASYESRQEQVSRVAREIARVIDHRFRGSSQVARVAHRSEGPMHVWRIRAEGDQPERFLRVAHRAMMGGEDAAVRLLNRLEKAGWGASLFDGSDRSLVLSSAGRLEPYPSR